jgi:cysteine-rich repeat protein
MKNWGQYWMVVALVATGCGTNERPVELSEDALLEQTWDRFVAANHPENNFAECGAIARTRADGTELGMRVEGLYPFGANVKYKAAKIVLNNLPGDPQAAVPVWDQSEESCMNTCVGAAECLGCICFAERVANGPFLGTLTCIGVKSATADCRGIQPHSSINWFSTLLLRETAYGDPAINCTLKSCLCGNGTVNNVGEIVRIEPYQQESVPEACDDGNVAAGDGCSPFCQVETGWVCSPGVPCEPIQ